MKIDLDNTIYRLLVELGLSTENSFEGYSDKVRDDDKIGSLKCSKSGCIILDSTQHVSKKNYTEKQELEYWSANDLSEARKQTKNDDNRRATFIREFVTGQRWLDFGSGNGGLLHALKGISSKACGVELQKFAREASNKEGLEIYESISGLPEKEFDVVTLFHVLEHLLHPLDILQELRGVMSSGAKLIIEVPHANDFLLKTLEVDAFKQFTLWSEHLILHTKKTLHKFLEVAGFKDIKIHGIQRYPLSNHLYWLRHGKPSGHEKLSKLNDENLHKAYEDRLAFLGQTDTLIAIAVKN